MLNTMSIVMHGTNNTCKHLLQLTILKIIYKVNTFFNVLMLQPTQSRTAVNVLPCVVAASRRGRISLVEQHL